MERIDSVNVKIISHHGSICQYNYFHHIHYNITIGLSNVSKILRSLNYYSSRILSIFRIKKHGEVIERTQKLIDEQKLNVERFNTINDELRVKLLRERVSECLHIKELLVPDESKPVSAFPELTPKQEAIVNNALDHRQPASEILCSKFNMNITRQDILTLAGLNWLNDEVINFYMNLIMERGKLNKWPSSYAMNTFFYPKIINGGQSSVRRWTRKEDIFSYDILVIPIHLRMHWCMALIDFRKKRITYYDSMGSSNMECLRALASYLEDEHLDKKKTEFKMSDWRLTNAKDIPQQMNGSDCGMFACMFAEVLTRDGEINFSQEHMPYLRRRMVLEILENRLFIS